ncbi:hypothetical protein BS78_05G232200 [Paspalum vaginatum]|nr:hypothetical protein BS78_05G232200 [Paspalum vaginatum]
MEALQHTLGSGWDDLGSLAAQSWLPPSLRSTGSSESTVPSSTGSTSGGSTSGVSESEKVIQLPPQILSLLQSMGSSEFEDPEQRSFDNRCIINLVKTYLPVPPPPPPAREISHKKPKYFLTANPNAVLKESKKLAKGALEHYNKKKKIKFELLDVMPVIMMIESGRLYTHINFTAKSKKEGSKEQIFFAELHNCGKRRTPSGFFVTCCEPLGSDTIVGHNGFQLDGGPTVRKNMDFTRCFACSTYMLHPKDQKYIAGHRNVPYIYNNTC